MEHGDQRVLRHLIPENRVRGYDVRPVIEALCDTGSVLELRAGFGTGVLTALARIGGHAITVAWPTGEFGGMGLEGAVRLGYRSELDAIEDPEARQARYDELVAEQYTRGKALSTAMAFEIDDVIDPADTRAVLAGVLARAGMPAERERCVFCPVCSEDGGRAGVAEDWMRGETEGTGGGTGGRTGRGEGWGLVAGAEVAAQELA